MAMISAVSPRRILLDVGLTNRPSIEIAVVTKAITDFASSKTDEQAEGHLRVIFDNLQEHEDQIKHLFDRITQFDLKFIEGLKKLTEFAGEKILPAISGQGCDTKSLEYVKKAV